MTDRIIPVLSASQRTALIAAARTFAEQPGVPAVRYRHLGRDRRGVDCLGLLVCSFRAIGFTGREVLNYSREADGISLEREMTAHFGDQVDTLQPGDVVLMRWHKSPNHLGLITDYPLAGQIGLIHSYSAEKRVVEHRFADPWPRRIDAAWRP